ncbi:MAG: hypothetical protein EGQ76_01465 [Sutterella sp.]|nr:hypothetical protein [Sutterella sp.]
MGISEEQKLGFFKYLPHERLPLMFASVFRRNGRRYSARKGHNPQTMEPLDIPAGRRARFTPGIGIERAMQKN